MTGIADERGRQPFAAGAFARWLAGARTGGNARPSGKGFR